MRRRVATTGNHARRSDSGDGVIDFAIKYWPVPTVMTIFAQSGSIDGLSRLFDLGAIGAVLAIMLWQQYTRESRLAKEVTDREDRMSARINALEERDYKSIEILTAHNHSLQGFIQDKLMQIVELQTANVNSCHQWRNEARQKLFTPEAPEDLSL